MTHAHSFFERRQKPLMAAAIFYVVFLIASHSTLPGRHVWIIAAFFSIAMNFTYITESLSRQKSIPAETAVAATLIIMSVAGAFFAPILVILAILGHGLLDIAKHGGAGVPFFSWYTLSCFAVDLAYSTTLLIYWWVG